jgi:hypothetical protein
VQCASWRDAFDPSPLSTVKHPSQPDPHIERDRMLLCSPG